MDNRTVGRNPFSSSERLKEPVRSMPQEEVRGAYDSEQYAPGREWAEWFTAKKLSIPRPKYK